MKEDNVIFFIGAGCSKDAKFPLSNDMVIDIEKKIVSDIEEWNQFKELYYFLKSSIIYSKGITGIFDHTFNVEDLLIVLYELEKKDKNLIFPFIGAWNNKLVELGGDDFSNVSKFRKLIMNALIKWVKKDDYTAAKYYEGFLKFQREIGYSVRIFSLNYDLCIEQILGGDCNLELGFDKKSNIWNHDILQHAHNNEAELILYKLHGSIDWDRNSSDGLLKKCVHPKEEPTEVIFGTEMKLKSIDPYLFYVFQFRQYSLSPDCRIIVIIGYSFSDEYLNDLLGQALKTDEKKSILVVEPFQNTKSKKESKIEDIANKLSVTNRNQIKLENMGAKKFLENHLSIQNLQKHIIEIDMPF
ncbi:MAG: SIR2 family protein [Crocinitomicaceae bacterium]|nr:SIR2 family protein [Crocinitomicaceae bacterium]